MEPLGVDFGRDGFDRFCGIDFRGGRFGDDDLRGLMAFVDLDHLDLSGTQITDALLPIVGRLRRITLLSLAETAITDPGLMHLSKLRRVRCVVLQRTRVTDEGVGHLQKALPQCRIVR